MAEQMSDTQLAAIIEAHAQAALGQSSGGAATGTTIAGVNDSRQSTLEIERAMALDYYNGRPMGNEVDNRSSVVLTPVRDTIEWIMPQLMRMFVATDEICRFDPVGPQDEELAAQETDVCNYLFMRANPGFTILHDLFKDALLLKNGYAKVYWNETTKEEFAQYKAVPEEMIMMIVQEIEQAGDKAQIIAKEERPQLDPMTGQPVMLYDVRIKRERKSGRVAIDCVAPEDVLVSPRCHDKIENSPFVAHRRRMTRSELLEMGFDKGVVWSIPIAGASYNLQSWARNTVLDENSSDDTQDRSMDDVEVLEAYVRVDYDRDGKAELRRVMKAGEIILENEECTEMPWASVQPIRMPHRHIGISLMDLLQDVQGIQTTLARQLLDNVYLNNNATLALDQNQVNLQDAITRGPGRVIRTDGPPSESLEMLQPPSIVGDLMGAMELVEKLKTDRTGVSDMAQGLDPDLLSNVTKGAYLGAQNAAVAKIEMIARVLADGVKDIMLLLHDLTMRYQQEALTLRLRNKWTQADPSQWRRREDVTINVGLGSNNREELRANLMLVGQTQQAAAQAGIVGPTQVYNLVSRLCKAIGFADADDFFLDPTGPQFQQFHAQQQQQPNPKVQAAQISAQAGVQKAQIAAQGNIAQVQAEQQMHTQELVLKGQIEAQKMHADLAKAGVNADADKMGAYMMAKQRHDEALMQLMASMHQTDQQAQAQFIKSLQQTAGSA